MAFQFTDANFNKEALEADKPVLVDFYADWCGPCKMMAPIIDELSKEYEGEIKIGKLNVDDNPNTASQYKVMTIPTMILYKDGKVVDTLVGVVSKNVLAEKLDAQK
ncbi:MAG: thioredoxin [Clostridiales bacterium]|nr:thioredoxin [Clostridiales bacterium]